MRGVKTTEPDVPAFCESQTPPPVVPRKTRFPVGSAGSMAMDEMRPVTRPKLGEITADGPSGCQTAVEALAESDAEIDGCGAIRAIRDRSVRVLDRFCGQFRFARNLLA